MRTASSARNVRPRTAETSSRMEDVLQSRKRGSEEVGPLDDPRLTPADELQMGSRSLSFVKEMAEKDGVYKTKVDL